GISCPCRTPVEDSARYIFAGSSVKIYLTISLKGRDRATSVGVGRADRKMAGRTKQCEDQPMAPTKAKTGERTPWSAGLVHAFTASGAVFAILALLALQHDDVRLAL